ncbi:hypothetical protein ES703_54901 [subsurface metagenome]
MDYVGILYHGVEAILSRITTTQQGQIMMIRLFINDKEMIKFPMPADSDSNAIKTAIEIVVRQTKLASIGIRVELEPVPA